jgi:hypothetical protein
MELAGPIDQARADLPEFSHLHREFVRECLAAVDAKKERMGGPVIGELFPHLLAQGLKLKDKDRRLLAASWLALYGYICIVDYELDQKGHLSGRLAIATSALLGWGIATLGHYTASTPYADVFVDNINKAFAGQYEDIKTRRSAAGDREQSDIDKNRAFVATIAGYCAAAGEGDDSLIRSAEALIRPFQILDDLQDLQEDYGENNLTPFVRIVTECVSAAQPLDRPSMYRALIKDSRTIGLVARAKNGVEEALLLLNADRDQSLISYIVALRERADALIQALEDHQRDPAAITEPEVMQRIEQIATSC